MAAGTLYLFWWELEATGDLGRAQTVALTTMVVFQMFHVGNCRSESRSVFVVNPFSNPFLFLATAAAFIVHVLALYTPVDSVYPARRTDRAGGLGPHPCDRGKDYRRGGVA
jgi:magnesium-transporting ATPase (P-type)